MKNPLSLFAIAAVFFSAPFASATVVIVGYDTSALTGTTVSLTPSQTASEITGMDLTRGIGLATESAGGGFNSSGWNWPSGLRQADDYVSFGFTVQPGYQVEDLNLVFRSQSSAAGPGPMGLYWSGDSFVNSLYTWNQPASAQNYVVDLSSLGIVSPGTYEFRFQSTENLRTNLTDTIATAGTWRVIGDSVGAFQITGLVTPEPTRAMLLSIALGTLLMRRRR